jgi:hypothetical protein
VSPFDTLRLFIKFEDAPAAALHPTGDKEEPVRNKRTVQAGVDGDFTAFRLSLPFQSYSDKGNPFPVRSEEVLI